MAMFNSYVGYVSLPEGSLFFISQSSRWFLFHNLRVEDEFYNP